MNDPRRQLRDLHVRRAQAKTATSTHARMGMIIKCWNLVLAGRSLSSDFPWAYREVVPEVRPHRPGDLIPAALAEQIGATR